MSETPLQPHATNAALSAIALSRHALSTADALRASILQLALTLQPNTSGYLLLTDPAITPARIRQEWGGIASILRPDLAARLTICMTHDRSTFTSIPHDPPAAVLTWLRELVAQTSSRPPTTRPDFDFIILKLLLHQYLATRQPLTTLDLTRMAGCSYPTARRALDAIAPLLVRRKDRAVALRDVQPRDIQRLLSSSDHARATLRFADRSGQPRSPESHLRRLEKLAAQNSLAGIAIGGVIGARHYFPAIDLVGTPRLDLSIHHAAHIDPHALAAQIDPALVAQPDPDHPADLVIHTIRHADPLFTINPGGPLPFADRVECLLDLYEARLEAQAAQFLAELSMPPTIQI